MKIWIEYEYVYTELLKDINTDFTTTVFIDPKVIQIHRNYKGIYKLSIWQDSLADDHEFVFEFDKIEGLLIDVTNSDDYIETKMKERILTEWKKHGK